MVQVTTAFARFLHTRCAATLTLAPGIATPRYFSDPRHEHLATRRAAGLFDFSFMCCADIAGPASAAFLASLQTRALDGLAAGRIAYTLLLRDDGTVLNDATVWRLGHDHYWLFVGRRGDFDHIADSARGFNVTVTDISQQHAVIALQGSASRRIIERCFAGRPVTLPYYGVEQLRFADGDCRLARIGYSGETGYEFVVADAAAPSLWRALCAAGEDSGLLECGFDAIDTLRIEAGHLLFTRELAAPVTPLELGLTRLIDFHAHDFHGAPALRSRRWLPLQRRLAGLLPDNQTTSPASLPDYLAPGCGTLTSVCWSPVFERTLGIGFVGADDAYPGSAITLADGTRARVARLPFYDPGKMLPRNAR
jgi:aminomethyltransferase